MEVLAVSYDETVAITYITKSIGALIADAAVPDTPLDTRFLVDGSLTFSGYFNSSYPHTFDNQDQGPGYRQRYLEGFFHFFHQAHPFLAPKEHAIELLRRKPIPHLETAMCYVASQYVDTRLKATFALELEALLASPDIPNDGFLVQALLLYVIDLDGNNEQSRASEVLTRARTLAIQLGMHQHDFAMLNGGGVPVLEESWRRTWWELYVVDGYIAGLHQCSTFFLFGIAANVSLPCEEDVFRSGVSSLKHNIREAQLIFYSTSLHHIQ